jgi:hypothetical protein
VIVTSLSGKQEEDLESEDRNLQKAKLNEYFSAFR